MSCCQLITEEMVESIVNEIFNEYGLWAKLYNKGYISKEEYYQRMEINIREKFGKFIRKNKLEICLNEMNYPQFIKEFEEYKNTNALDNANHIPWLYNVAQEKCEASFGDQKLIFSMIKKLEFPLECFEPLPDSIPSFDIDCIHQYAFEGIYATKFNCVDDGGLLEDDNPIGKTYKLRNEQGLEAVLTIVSEEMSKYREPDKRIPTSFVTKGYIEGLTAIKRTGNPEIKVHINTDSRNKPWYITFWDNDEDLLARSAYPLWQEYFKWCDERQAEEHSMLFPLFDKFIEQNKKVQ